MQKQYTHARTYSLYMYIWTWNWKSKKKAGETWRYLLLELYMKIFAYIPNKLVFLLHVYIAILFVYSATKTNNPS